MRNTHGEVLLLVNLQIKLKLLHGCFSRCFNYTHNTKSLKAFTSEGLLSPEFRQLIKTHQSSRLETFYKKVLKLQTTSQNSKKNIYVGVSLLIKLKNTSTSRDMTSTYTLEKRKQKVVATIYKYKTCIHYIYN